VCFLIIFFVCLKPVFVLFSNQAVYEELGIADTTDELVSIQPGECIIKLFTAVIYGFP